MVLGWIVAVFCSRVTPSLHRRRTRGTTRRHSMHRLHSHRMEL